MLKFREKVLQVVSRIAKGKVLTYKEVAVLSGSPKSYRAVGNILKRNRNLDIPCHRVVRSDGKLGDYNRGKNIKARLLKSEGVKI